MIMNALEVCRLITEFDAAYDRQVINSKEQPLFERIWTYTEQLTPVMDRGGVITAWKLWLREERGPLENVTDENIPKRFPEESEWFRLELMKIANTREIYLNGTRILQNIETINSTDDLEGFIEMSEWLIEKIAECIERMKNGSYEKWVEENISYRFRFGKIFGGKLLSIYPELSGKVDAADSVTLAPGIGITPYEGEQWEEEPKQVWINELPFDERFEALKEKVRWEDIPKSSGLI